MSTARGIVVGSLGLAALDLLVSTDQAADRAGGLLTGVANAARAFMSPDVPAIRDRSGCLDPATGKTAPAKGKRGGGSLLPVVSPVVAVAEHPGALDFVSPVVGVAKRLIP